MLASDKNLIYGESFVEADEVEKAAILNVLLIALTEVSSSTTLARMRAKKFIRLACQ